MTTGCCPVCRSSAQPLISNIGLYGCIAFHRQCEAKLFTEEFVTEMEAVFSATYPSPKPYETMRFNGFSWVDDEDYR